MKNSYKNLVIKSIVFSFFILVSQPIFSQIEHSKFSESYIDSLNNLAYTLTFSDIDSAFTLAYLTEKLSKNLNYKIGLGYSYFILGTSYYSDTKKDSTLFYLNKSVNLLKSMNIQNLKKSKTAKRILGDCYIILGFTSLDKLNYSQSLEYFNKSLTLYKAIGHSSGISISFLNIANVYAALGDSEKQMNYLVKGSEIAKQNTKSTTYIYSLNAIGKNYIKKDFKKAYRYFNESITLSKELGLKEIIGDTYINFSTLYAEQNNFISALENINNAIALYKEIGNFSYIISADVKKIEILEKLNLYDEAMFLTDKLLGEYLPKMNHDLIAKVKYIKGKLNFNLKKYSDAKTNLLDVLALPKSNDNLSIFRDTYKLLYEIAELEKNHKEAFKQYKNYSILRDSVNIAETKAKGLNFEKLRELRVKEKEIEDLKKDKIISNLEISSQKSFRNFLFISFVLLGIIVLIVFLNNIKIRAFNSKLKLLNESEQRFLRIISHDIRNSLGAVINFSNMLINDKYLLSEKETDDSIAEINKAALATNNLLTNLLQWTLAKKDDLSFTPKNENLKDIVEEGIASSQSLITIKELKLSINIDDDIIVFIDSYSITSVIRNLLTNAIKFSNLGGEITFNTKIIGKFVELSLTDTGVGMDAATVSNLFKNNVHNTTKGTNNEKGTGIGLSLVKRFIETNGGTISVKSKLGKGSTFSFTMPLGKDNVRF